MTNQSHPRFDESLVVFVRAIKTLLNVELLQDGVFVRDNVGQLGFVAPTAAPSDKERDRLSAEIKKLLGAYGRSDRLLVFKDDPGAQRLLNDSGRLVTTVDNTFCKIIDRRIVGSAWLNSPKEEPTRPPRIVFASVKGGVGRSTALAVAAADLSARGQNVLVVDLDMEAPGLGDILLLEERMPRFGTIDFLVENGIGGIAEADVAAFIGSSSLTTSGGGRVDVVPAFGRESDKNPENILPKLARAMIEDISDDGDSISVSEQVSKMIEVLVSRSQYDVVLIDSRAGLAELTAPAVLGLGATVLLFGTAQQQTISSYRALFAGLRMLAQRDRVAGRNAAWRLMLKAVYAKASLDPNVAARHRDDLYDLFSEFLYDEESLSEASQVELESQAVTFALDDTSAPHWPLIIPFSSSFVDFDSVRNANQMTQAFYEQTFRQFMDGIDEIIRDSRTPLNQE